MNYISKLNIFLLAARPKTLGATLAPVLIGTSMAFTEGKGNIILALAILISAMLIQIGTNFSNDYFDFIKGADTSERLGPKRVTQAGLIKPEIVLKYFVLIFGLAFLVGIYLVFKGGWPILIIGILSIVCGILYTCLLYTSPSPRDS